MKRSNIGALGGLAAGVAGTVAMGGAAFLVRRMVEPTKPVGKTHYESVIEWATGSDNDDHEMEPATRIRSGELLHLGFGAFWGMVFAIVTAKRTVRPIADGTTFGLILWLGAFGGYLPVLGISRSLREMGNFERLRTLIAHLTFGVTTFTFLRAFGSESAPGPNRGR